MFGFFGSCCKSWFLMMMMTIIIMIFGWYMSAIHVAGDLIEWSLN